MYLITLTHIATGEEMQSYTNPLPMSTASINHLERTYGIAVTQTPGVRRAHRARNPGSGLDFYLLS
jgi:hypothetical protein